MVVKDGSGWALRSKNGKKVIHKFKTRAEALAMETAIRLNQLRKAGKKIPEPKK